MLNAHDATDMAERLGKPIESHQTPHNGQPHTITISIGVPEADQSKYGMDELIRRADLAAYATKKTGRNRIGVAASTATG